MRLRCLFAVAIFFFAALSARADTFSFSFAGAGQSGSGEFTAVATSTQGEYLITGVTGTVDGLTIASLLTAGVYPIGPNDTPNDNLLFFPGTAGTYFDFPGVSFRLSDGTYVNLFDEVGPQILFGTAPGADTASYSLDTLNIAQTPEPSSLALLGTGVLGLAAVVRRRIVVPAS